MAVIRQFVHTADLHLGAPRVRFDGRGIRCLTAMAEQIGSMAQHDVPITVCLDGDVFNTHHPKPDTVADALTWCQTMMRTPAVDRLVYFRGNHERKRLVAKDGSQAAEDDASLILGALDLPQDNLTCLSTPYDDPNIPSVRYLPDPYRSAEDLEEYTRVVVGHFAPSDAYIDAKTPTLGTGVDVREAFGLKPTYVIVGDVHTPQVQELDVGKFVVIPGSPYPVRLTDNRCPRSYVVLNAHDDGSFSVDVVPLRYQWTIVDTIHSLADEEPTQRLASVQRMLKIQEDEVRAKFAQAGCLRLDVYHVVTLAVPVSQIYDVGPVVDALREMPFVEQVQVNALNLVPDELAHLDLSDDADAYSDQPVYEAATPVEMMHRHLDRVISDQELKPYVVQAALSLMTAGDSV